MLSDVNYDMWILLKTKIPNDFAKIWFLEKNMIYA